MALHTGAVLKKDVRRYVPDLDAHLNLEHRPTGSREASQPLHVNERPAEGAQCHGHVAAEATENRFFQPENVLLQF